MSISQVTFTQESIYAFLYSWVNKVLNVDPNRTTSIAIIKANQNGPAPVNMSSPYMAIGRAAKITKEGRSYKSDSESDGTRTLINDYSLKVEIWEVNSDGDLLWELINSTDMQSIHDLWSAAGLAYVQLLSPVQDLTALQNGVWRYEHMIEIMINASMTLTENAGLIQDVDIAGTIPPDGESVNHHDINIPGGT